MKFNPHQWYLNGLKKTELVNNTFIGGVSSTITSASDLAAKLEYYPSGLTMDAADIHNFTIVGDNIECYIGVDYNIIDNAFNGNTNITYYKDLDNKCKRVGLFCFRGATNLTNIALEGLTSIDGAAFQQTKFKIGYFPNCISLTSGIGHFSQCSNLEIVYLPICINFGTDVGYNSIFGNSKLGLKVYAEPTMETINGGGVEGDLAYVTSNLNGTVVYVDNFTAPNPITDLAVGSVYGTAIQLTFTPPSSTNTIDFYEVYIDGFYNNRINGSGGYAVGLDLNTSYNITVKAVDIYYNRSTSNTVTQTTNASLTFPYDNIVSYWQLENNVLDSVGSNNGTATAITYATGQVGNAAVFNGTNSIIKMTGYNTGFNGVDFSVVQLFKTTQTTAYRLLQNRGQGASGTVKGWQISQSDGITWGNLVIDDGLGNFLKMDNIPYNEDDNAWHNLIMTWKASTGTCSIYIDGNFKGSKTDANLINANLNGLDVCFGGSNTDGQLFNGQGDEALIFNKELSAIEVSDIYTTLNAGNHLI